MITGIELFSARTKAHIMADIILTGKTGNSSMAMGSREWDSLTEMGDGCEVVKEFLRLYKASTELQAAVKANDRYIGIENLLRDPAYCGAAELSEHDKSMQSIAE